MSYPKVQPGEPQRHYFDAVDEHNRVLRLAMIAATERLVIEMLTAGVERGVITDAQAQALRGSRRRRSVTQTGSTYERF